MRGQGGIVVGDNVLFGPRTQVLAVDHVFTDPEKPIMDQGITAQGMALSTQVWATGTTQPASSRVPAFRLMNSAASGRRDQT